jgi:hypothetical protein
MPWAVAGLSAGAQETITVTARIYGDGAQRFTLTKGGESQYLIWSNGHENVDGAGSSGEYAWKLVR